MDHTHHDTSKLEQCVHYQFKTQRERERKREKEREKERETERKREKEREKNGTKYRSRCVPLERMGQASTIGRKRYAVSSIEGVLVRK